MTDNDDPKQTIDITSPRFDAFTALYSRNVRLPSPHAPVLDNLSKFRETEEGILVNTFSKGKVQKADESKASTSKRRFLPHQEPVAGRARRTARTVLTRMNNVEGPLALLQKCMDQRIRVKVGAVLEPGTGPDRHHGHTRIPHLGRTEAESGSLSKTPHTSTLPLIIPVSSPPYSFGPGDDVEVPTVKVTRRALTATTEECERHVPQMMMRGEHVVTVAAQDS